MGLQELGSCGGYWILEGIWNATSIGRWSEIKIDTKTNVYGFAKLCCEILTRLIPFDGHLY
jgi:hypothetical protein